MPQFQISSRLHFPKQFPSNTSGIAIDHYKLSVLPAERPELQSQAVITFPVEADHLDELLSFVHRELRILCDYLGVIFNTEVHYEGLRVNDSDCILRQAPENRGAEERNTYSDFYGELDPEKARMFGRLLYMNDPVATQFTRACRMYIAAIQFIPNEPEIANLLLVSAVECLSSHNGVFPPVYEVKTKNEEGLTSRFCRFIEINVLECERRLDRKDRRLFIEILKTVYRTHRSGFVHGGKEVSVASIMADDHNRPYFKNYPFLGNTDLKAKERNRACYTPGMKWLAHICRSAIIGFFQSLPAQRTDADLKVFSKIARKQAVVGIGLKANRKTPLEQGKKFEMGLDEVDHE